jgi:hypothetical protein
VGGAGRRDFHAGRTCCQRCAGSGCGAAGPSLAGPRRQSWRRPGCARCRCQCVPIGLFLFQCMVRNEPKYQETTKKNRGKEKKKTKQKKRDPRNAGATRLCRPRTGPPAENSRPLLDAIGSLWTIRSGVAGCECDDAASGTLRCASLYLQNMRRAKEKAHTKADTKTHKTTSTRKRRTAAFFFI